MTDFFPDANEVTVLGENGIPTARIDPFGGVRMRSPEDALAVTIDRQGYKLSSTENGLVTAEIKHGSFRLVDPTGTDDIEMTTSSGGTLPNPAYRVAVEANPGGSLVAPAAPRFTTSPAADFEIYHVAAWIRAGSFPSATMTPPAGCTEQLDAVFADADGTIHTSIATRGPAEGTAGTFTSSLTGWQHAIGTHVVIKGATGTVPSFRSVATATAKTSDGSILFSGPKPAGLAVGDVILAFITLGVNGGFVPDGWDEPDGFVPLGAIPISTGSGTTQSTLATGVWAKLADADDVAASEFSTNINLPSGIKMLHGAMVAVQNPFLVPGGVQLRMAGHPIRRLLFPPVELSSNSATLADWPDIPQGYDNLEVIIDAASGTVADNRGVAIQFNGDTTAARYFDRRIDNGVDFGQNFQVNGHIFIGQISGIVTNQKAAGNCHIYGYAKAPRVITSGQFWHTDGVVLHIWNHGGQYDRVAPITRVQVLIPTAGGTIFQAGSRAYLYGY